MGSARQPRRVLPADRLVRLSDHISNHITARVPGTQNEFLINPYGIFYEQKHGLLEWPALLHKLDVIDASFHE